MAEPARMLRPEGKTIGERIALARRQAGLTQELLAERFGIGTRTLQYWESGAIVPYRFLDRLAAVLGCDRRWLVLGEAPRRQNAGLDELRARWRDTQEEFERLQRNLLRLQANSERLRDLARARELPSGGGGAAGATVPAPR